MHKDSISGNNPKTRILICDDPGEGGAPHRYKVVKAPPEHYDEFAVINFQKGPVQEQGINGCQNEDLLEIVLNRLRSFQSGSHPCPENQQAIQCIENGLGWLRLRTSDRVARGVEGTSKQ